MMFTSKDLPLALTTPVTSGEYSADSPMCAVTAPRRVHCPLVTCATTLMLVVRTVLASLVDTADAFTRLAAHSHQSLNLIQVTRAAPLPPLSAVTPQYYARVYRAALNLEPSPFDVVKGSSPLHDYIDRVVELTDASNCVLLTAFIYLDRLVMAAPHLFLRSTNVHKLFAVAFMLAVKFHEDDYLTAQFFSRALGIAVDELNRLELYFLRCVNYDLFVTPDCFRDTQITLMAAAIHSENGLPVLHTLRHRGISDLSHAYSRAKPWHVYPKNAYSRRYTDSHLMSPDVMGPEDHAIACLHGPVVETKETRSILAELAAVQLHHDFPHLPSQPYAGALQSRYNQNGIVRYAILRLLANMELVDDVTLPPLEYQWQSLQERWKVPTIVAHNETQPGPLRAGAGFGSFLVNARHVAAIYGSRTDDESVPSGIGLWHYVPPREAAPQQELHGWESEDRGGIGPVVTGGLGLASSIWSAPAGHV